MRLLFPKHLSRFLGHDWGARAPLSCPQLAEKPCVDHFLYGGEQTFLWSAATRVINEVINQYGRPSPPKTLVQFMDVALISLIPLLFRFLSSSPDRTGLSEQGGGGHGWICSRDRRQLLRTAAESPGESFMSRL